jgi:putative ABC transport system ATP-binding protein
VIQIQELQFAYGDDSFQLRVDSLQVEARERVAFIGPSGSGKSTLVHLIAGILTPQVGSIVVQRQPLGDMTEPVRRDFRLRNIGLVFQEFELIEYLSVFDNMLLPYRMNRSMNLDDAVRQRARDLAGELGVASKLARYPTNLSQGERQRVAIGRALVTEPTLLLADEPTGNLDPRNKRKIVDLLLHQADQRDLTVVMVTHDHGLLDQFQNVIDVDQFHFEDLKTKEPPDQARVGQS